MGWLFYKSLDEQGEITASPSHLNHGLSPSIPGRGTRSQQDEGRVGWARGGSQRGLCVWCHSQGLYLLHNRVAAGQTWRELAVKLSWSERHLC